MAEPLPKVIFGARKDGRDFDGSRRKAYIGHYCGTPNSRLTLACFGDGTLSGLVLSRLQLH